MSGESQFHTGQEARTTYQKIFISSVGSRENDRLYPIECRVSLYLDEYDRLVGIHSHNVQEMSRGLEDQVR